MMKIFKILWQLPQYILGWYISRGARYRKDICGKKLYYVDYGEGMSFGEYILLNPNYKEESGLLRHEFGHSIQSLILGPSYLLVIFLPSWLWWKYIWNLEKDYYGILGK